MRYSQNLLKFVPANNRSPKVNERGERDERVKCDLYEEKERRGERDSMCER